MKLIAWLGGLIVCLSIQTGGDSAPPAATAADSTALPSPRLTGETSLEEAIAKRRSVREFANAPLTAEQISQLCWAAQGITDPDRKLRAVPSAGAKYPIEIYLVRADGVDHYEPAKHQLQRHLTGDVRPKIQAAAVGQESVGQAPLTMVVAAVQQRTAGKYGDRAERYCFIEAGHVGQNVLLQAVALGLAGVPIGAFEDQAVAGVLRLPKDHRVLYLLPIGRPR